MLFDTISTKLQFWECTQFLHIGILPGRKNAVNQKRKHLNEPIIPHTVSSVMPFRGKVMVSPPFLCPPSNPLAYGLILEEILI